MHKILYPGAFRCGSPTRSGGPRSATSSRPRRLEKHGRCAQEKLLEDPWGRDERFLSLGESDADASVLEDAEQCMMAKYDPANVEISSCGGLPRGGMRAVGCRVCGRCPWSPMWNRLTDRDPSYECSLAI